MKLVRTVARIVAIGGLVLPIAAEAFRGLAVGTPVPAVSVEDVDGKAVSLPPGGRPAVVVFWRPNQRISEDVLRDLSGVVRTWEARGVTMVAIAEAGADPEASRLRAREIPLRFLRDPEGRAGEAFGVIVFPSTAVVAADGTLAYYLPSRNTNYRLLLEAHLQRVLGDISEEELAERVSRAGEVHGTTAEAAQAAYKRGVALAHDRQFHEAVAALSQALHLRPDLMEAHLQLGYAKLELGEARRALAEFELVLEDNPVSPGARVGRAIAHLRLGKTEEGIRLLEEAVTLNPEPVRGHYELARAYEAKGDLEAATRHYRWAYRKLLQGRK